MTAPVPHTWVDGEFASAAGNLNPGVRDVLAFLLDPPRCKLRNTAAQSIPASAYTALTFNTEDYDNEPSGLHDPSTNPSRITIRTAGTYVLLGQVGWAGNTTGRRGARIDQNGAVIPGCQNIWAPGTTQGIAYPAPVILVPCSVGDYLELKVFQESGGALSTVATSESQSRFEARWMGP